MAKWKSSKTVGNETEAIVETWLQALNIPYKRENTMLNTRTRNKGSVDFVGDTFAIEVKRFTKLLTFKPLSNVHDLHWDQITFLSRERIKGKIAGILITEDNTEFVFVSIDNFLKWYRDCTRKSINMTIAKSIGYVVTSEQDLKRVLT